MFLSLEWLGDFVDLDLSDPALPERLAEEMFMGGLEAELIDQAGEGLDSLLIAEVISAEKHPGADRLTLCSVHDGTAERQIVCGAPPPPPCWAWPTPFSRSASPPTAGTASRSWGWPGRSRPFWAWR